MRRSTIALFGEAQKGEFLNPYFCSTLAELSDFLGEPPKESKGLLFAVQTLLYEQEVLFFRVHEEGYSIADYLKGMNVLGNENNLPPFSAVCLPGVGNHEIIEATMPILTEKKGLLILSESDLYDYLTHG